MALFAFEVGGALAVLPVAEREQERVGRQRNTGEVLEKSPRQQDDVNIDIKRIGTFVAALLLGAHAVDELTEQSEFCFHPSAKLVVSLGHARL
jgi:hypothetical protein